MPRKKKPQRAVRWGDGTIQERKTRDGYTRYQARWLEMNSPTESVRRSRTFRTEQDAESFLRSIGEAKRAGRFSPEPLITLEESIAAYMMRRERRQEWSSNTVSTYRILCNRLVYPQIGSLRVTRITYVELQSWVDRLLDAGKSSSAVSNALGVVKQALRAAVTEGIIPQSPAADVTVKRFDNGRRERWDPEEIDRLLLTVQCDAKWHAFYRVALVTGMRPGELRAMKWADVDWHRGAITTIRTVTRDRDDREIIGTQTKTRYDRHAALDQRTIDVLRLWKREQAAIQLASRTWHKTDIIFDRGDGDFLRKEQLMLAHKDWSARAGIRPLSPHHLRHTHISLEEESGANDILTRQRTGHMSRSMQGRYTHFTVEYERAAAEATARRLTGGEASDTTTSPPEERNSEQLDA